MTHSVHIFIINIQSTQSTLIIFLSHSVKGGWIEWTDKRQLNSRNFSWSRLLPPVIYFIT